MPYQFDRIATQKLIILYEQQPNLYDVGSPNYKNKVKRTESYKEIAAEMNKLLDNPGITQFDINKKINNLRTQYFVELNKVRNSEVSGAGTSSIYIPSWWCFKELSFLSGTTAERKGESNLDRGVEESLEDDENSEVLYEGTITEINADLEEEYRLSQASTPTTSGILPSSRKRKRGQQDDTASLLASAVSALNNEKNEPIDHLEAFGQMVTSEMRRVNNQYELNLLKVKILHLIYEEVHKEI